MQKKNLVKAKRQQWDRIWLEEYRRFLKLKPGEPITVETKQIIDFLIDIRRRGRKAWQRMQALKAIRSAAQDVL